MKSPDVDDRGATRGCRTLDDAGPPQLKLNERSLGRVLDGPCRIQPWDWEAKGGREIAGHMSRGLAIAGVLFARGVQDESLFTGRKVQGHGLRC